MYTESFIRLPPDGTGKKTRSLYREALDTYEQVSITKDIERVNAFYAATLIDSPFTANRHHISIWNDSSMYLRVHAIILEAHSDRTTTTINIQFRVQRISNISGGTPLPITKLDNRSPDLDPEISIRHNPTVTLKEAPLALISLHNSGDGGNTFIHFIPVTAIVVAPNEGLTIQQFAFSDRGSLGAVIYFSTEVISI